MMVVMGWGVPVASNEPGSHCWCIGINGDFFLCWLIGMGNGDEGEFPDVDGESAESNYMK